MRDYTREQFLEDLKHPYAWPGGYALHFFFADGESLCYTCAVAEQKTILDDWETFGGSWAISGCGVHWEGPPDFCAHCNHEIPSEYGDPEEEQS